GGSNGAAKGTSHGTSTGGTGGGQGSNGAKGTVYKGANASISGRGTDYTNNTDTHSSINASVTLNINGGDTRFKHTGSITARIGYAMPTLAANELPTRPGYTFTGYWTGTNSNGTKYYNADGTSAHCMDFKQGTLYAGWTETKYNISFSGNGATSGTMSSISNIAYTATKTLTSNAFERKYTVTYNANSGMVSPSSETAVYTFAGWNSSSNIVYNTREYASTAVTSGYNDFAQWTIFANPIFEAGDQYVLEYDAKGSGTLTNYFYGDSGYRQVANGTCTNGATTTSTDGNLGVALSSSYQHFKVTYTLSANGDGAKNKYMLFRCFPGNTATIKNVKIYRLSNYADGATVKGLSAQGGTVSMVAQWNSASVTLPTPTRTGWTFTGWYDAATEGNLIGEAGDAYTPASDKTLYAHWTRDEYTISYDLQGGSLPAGTSNPESYNVESADITLVNPERTGYDFHGWGGTGLGSTTNNNPVTIPQGSTGDRSYTAYWDAHEYYIYYDGNEGGNPAGNLLPVAGSTERTEKTYDTNATLAVNGFSRSGYTFKEWNTASDGSGDAYASGGTLNRDYATVNDPQHPVTLYAIWEPIDYTVTFLLACADADPFAAITYNPDTSDKLPTPTRTGWTFEYWTVDGAVGNWADGASVNDKAALLGKWGSVKLTAHWKVNEYTIVFDKNSGSYADDNPSHAEVAQMYKAYTDRNFLLNQNDKYAKPGYEFLGWDVDPNWTPTVSDALKNALNAYDPNTYDASYDFDGVFTAMDRTELNNFFGPFGNDNATTQQKAVFEAAKGSVFPTYYVLADGNSSGLNVPEPLTETDGATVTFYAVWKAHNYKIKLNPNEGSYNGSFGLTTLIAHYGDEITLAVPVREGHEFRGWQRIDGNIGINNLKDASENYTGVAILTVMDSDATIAVRWKANGYILTVDPNGGTYDGMSAGDEDLDMSADFGTATTITLDLLNRDGYEFTGWTFVGPEGTWVWNESAGYGEFTRSKAGNATLTANWTPIKYTISFDADGGEGTMADIENVEYNQSVTLPANVFTRTGYDFLGWTFNGEDIEDGATVMNLVTVKGENAVLKAKWRPHTYTVRFHTSEGTGTMDDQNFVYGTAQNLNVNLFIRTGMHVDGWATTDGGAVVYTDGQQVNNLTTVDGAVIDLYAVWLPNVYTVAYNANGGEGEMPSVDYDYGETKALSANIFTRTGYIFKGWATSPTGEKAYDDGESVSNLTEAHGVTVTMYAVWQPITYTVVFHANNGSSDTTEKTFTYDNNESFPLNTFTRTGYTFVKWTVNSDGTGASYGNGFTVGKDTVNLTAQDGAVIDLYALWKANTYTVNFFSNPPKFYRDDVEEDAVQQTFTYDVAANLDPNPYSFDGYDFLGWALSKTATAADYTDGEQVLNLIASGSVPMYAVWQAKTYNFTVNNANGTSPQVSTFTLDDEPRYLSLAQPEREGYHITGWTVVFATDPAETTTVEYTCADQYTFYDETDIAIRPVDITATANWAINKYTITFENIFVDAPYDQQTVKVDHGGSIAAADMPYAPELIQVNEEIHFRFDKWNPINGESFSNIVSDFWVNADYQDEEHIWNRAEEDGYLAPSCEEMGYENFVCECGETKHVDFPAVGHTMSEWEYDAENHKHTGTCDRCGQTVTENCVFDEGEVINTSYTASNAIKRFTCEICGGYYEIPWQIPAHTHIGGTATCVDRAKCDICGMPYGEYDNHNHKQPSFYEGEEPDCTHKGYTDYTRCDFCGEELTKKTILPALGHLDEDQDYICDRCGETLPGAGDNPGGIIVDPTGGHTGTSFASFECSMCSGGRQVTGFNTVIHFFVHLVQYISYLFGGAR
ncbi:MAG: InlB B-repeat-containing protein, partial [Clostridia bacterium]|nr:InlB B-repeat-containing protein [Clostridia bacterium]